MIKNVLLATAFVVASSPAFVSAQDFFFSFDENSRVSTLDIDPDTSSTGSVFIFADGNLAANQIDVDFSNSDDSVIAFTSATAFDTDNSFSSLTASDTSNTTAEPTATDGRIAGLSFLTDGIGPAFQSSDAEFRSGANGFLLAQVNFNVVGEGVSELSFILGDFGVVNGAAGLVPVGFGTGRITVAVPTAVPEPSSAVLLILGVAGVAARRRRS